jgi:hypothetical protein
MEPQFAPALSRLQSLLNGASSAIKTPIQFAVIGGLSMAAWGIVRATQDIDFLADSEPSPIENTDLRHQLKKFFDGQHCRAEWRVGEHGAPVPLLLRIKLARHYGGLGADILWAHALAPTCFGAGNQREIASSSDSSPSSGGSDLA